MSRYSTAQSLTILSGPGNNVVSYWTRERHGMNVTSTNLESDSDAIPPGPDMPFNTSTHTGTTN